MRILIVEDDKGLAMAIAYRLKKEGFETESTQDGADASTLLLSQPFDLVLLDRMLPGMDGVAVLKQIRAAQRPVCVLMLTAMDGIGDRVTGLDAGADDYLVKPFAMDELMARIRALSRRQAPWNPQDTVRAGDLWLSTDQWTLRCREASVTLSRREGRLMEFFLRNAGQTLPRSVILDRVWSDSLVEDGNLDIHVHFLRKRLLSLGSLSTILTIRGVGYRFAGA